MCAREDFGVEETMKAANKVCKCAADGCELTQVRWTEQDRTIPFPRVEDIVSYQANPDAIEPRD